MAQVGCSPRIPSATRRDTESSPDDSLSLSEPTTDVISRRNTTTSAPNFSPTTPTASPTPNWAPLSQSEPFLRFPRPQGNHQLASWISSSDPAIMRVVSTDEPGLSGSTYELITSSDSDGQSDPYIESMSASLGSLDFQRPDDDLNSLAGTEHTCDDESITDSFEPVDNPVNEVQQVYDEADVTASLDDQAQSQSQATISELAPHDDKAEYESEDDSASRSSLDYTQESLGTPSIPTPEASKIVDRPAEDLDVISSFEEDEETENGKECPLLYGWYQTLREKEAAAWSMITDTGFSIPPVILALIALLIPVLVSMTSPPTELHIPTATPAVTARTMTSFVTTTETLSLTHALSSTTTKPSRAPVENAKRDEVLFGGKNPDVVVFKQQSCRFLVQIPDKVKYTWLLKNCLSFSATRELDSVVIDVSVVDDGMQIKFPRAECHGAVQVELTAQCQPKAHQRFQIEFEKGIVEEALEKTKNFAQNLTDFVPAAAQEAERCIEGARRSLESASDNVWTSSESLMKNIVTRIHNVHRSLPIKELATRFHNVHRSLSPLKADIQQRLHQAKDELLNKVDIAKVQATKHLTDAQDVPDEAKIALLHAQINAKLWWLKITKNEGEYERYASKAKQYLADKKAEKDESITLRRRHVDKIVPGSLQVPFWKRLAVKHAETRELFKAQRKAHRMTKKVGRRWSQRNGWPL